MISYLTPRCGSARLSSANLSMRSSRLAVFSGTWGGGGQFRHTRVALLFCKSHLNQSKWFPKVADAVVNVVWRVKLGQDLQEILEYFQ